MTMAYIYIIYYLFKRLDVLFNRKNPPSIPPRVQDKITGTTSVIEGVIADLQTPILFVIIGETTREALIELHRLISGNAASVVSNLGWGRHRHLTIKMTAED